MSAIRTPQAMLAVLAAAFLALASTLFAIPDSISISGRIDSPARTIDGTFTAQIDFFETSASVVVLASSTSSVTVSAGVFSANVSIPDSLLTLDSLFYEVAIDIDENGIDAGDTFDGRFEVTSVPYSLGARPVPAFLTAPVQAFPTIVAPQLNDIQLIDFVTPPGGVRYSHMSLAHVVGGMPGAVTFSFAIYTESGTIVSGPAVVSFSGPRPWTIHDETVPEVVLPPNTRFYAAFATNNAAVVVPSAVGNSLPFGRGFIPDAAPAGVLPASFNPATIVFNADPTTGVYPSIALFTPPPIMP